MQTYFKQWRRKIGAITLVLACILAAGWMRSRVVNDGIYVHFANDDTYGLISSNSSCHFLMMRSVEREGRLLAAAPSFTYGMEPHPDERHVLTALEVDWELRWSIASCGVRKFVGMGYDMSDGFIPYWSFVIPLTLSSAYLLLGRQKYSAHQSSQDSSCLK